MLLTEERVTELITIASQYAILRNLDVEYYLEGMLNTNTIGDADARIIVENLIKYHKDWIQKS